MRRLAFVGLIVVLVAASGCTLFWEHGSGGGGDDVCVQAEDTRGGAPAFEPAPLRDPGNLTCTSFGGGCNPECGPCPAATANLTPPIPSWGVCGSECDFLNESACAANAACRVVKDAGCTVGQNTCLTDFLGCFPTDTAVDASINCFTADAWDCSRNRDCTAHHAQQPCPLVDGSSQCARPFSTCTPKNTSPGSCTGVVSCRALAPTCPSGSVPGIENGCWTGACIVSTTCPNQA